MQNKIMERKLKNAWNNMKARCTRESYHHYSDYGGRGISFSKEWESFEKFCEDVGEPSDMKMELDREDGNGDYCKQNTRWVTKQKNQANRYSWGKSGLPRGVFKIGRKFVAQISINGSSYKIGRFDNATEAGIAFVEIFIEWNGFESKGKQNEIG